MITQLPIGLVGSNCYIVYDQEKGRGAVVDPGGEIQAVLNEIKKREIDILYILNTHGHFDHTVANAKIKANFDVPLGLHPDDYELLKQGGGASWFNLPTAVSPMPDLQLVEGLILEIGTLHIQVYHTPGHTPGGVCFYIPEDHALLTGDTLFAGSVGRTDLPGGDAEQLAQSLYRLLTLPPQTIIYPGHGPSTTLQQELKNNPWLRK